MSVSLLQITRARRRTVRIWTILESVFSSSTETSPRSSSLLSATFFRPHQLSVTCSSAMRVARLPFFVSWFALRAQKQLSSEKKSKLALLAAEPSRNWFAETLTYSNETRLALTSDCTSKSWRITARELYVVFEKLNLDFYLNSTLYDLN